MDWQRDLYGLLAGFGIAVVTSPVGVSGAVFLLPVQLTILAVPNPQVTPTNLLYNVMAGPGALVRYLRRRPINWPLLRQLTLGSAPGVIVGAVLRVYVASDPTVFRLIAAAVLLPTGLLILSRRAPDPLSPTQSHTIGHRAVTLMSFVVGIVGGLYGIGGGSIMGPILIGTGMTVAAVAPAALASTFLTSVIGVLTYAALSLKAEGTISPDWSLGIACGIGGLIGGYLGAYLQPHLPERLLRGLIGVLAISLALLYVLQAL